MDWAHDDILEYAIKLIEQANVAATWFVTHDTPLLSRLRSNPNFELGIHPNFNFLLSGDFRYGKNIKEVIEKSLEIVPEATSVRSHSLTQSSVILQAFGDFGLTHECNLLLPAHLKPKPFLHWNSKLLRVPHIFEDDVECINHWSGHDWIKSNQDTIPIIVADFHPIHVFLNTENLDRYEKTRHFQKKYKLLLDHVNHNSFGAKNALQELLRAAN
ncbi:polysaccharide deacetylase WbmS family protein [Desulfonatronum parangueonense]